MSISIIGNIDLYLCSFVENKYRSLGCWTDKTNDRAIPKLEGSSPVLDGNYTQRTHPIKKCFEVASCLGYDVFALQNGGMCASSATARDTYKKHGTSSKCSDDGKGGSWANEVYERVKSKFFICAEIWQYNYLSGQ